MKKQIYSLIAISGVLLLILSIFNSCIKEEIFAKATVETSQVTSITEATATCGGIITADGGSDVTSRGVCWSNSPAPTIENDTTIAAPGNSAFTCLLKGLSPDTTYYIRAYAVNKGGVSYGLQILFTTKSGVIDLTTSATSLITAYTATSGGTITSDGGAPVTERGICWNTSSNPTTANSKTIDGTGFVSFTSDITGLSANTLYYVRAYATNRVGTAYGTQVSFTTLSDVILLTTNATSLITAYTATSGGTITSDGGAPVTERGICWNTSPAPTTVNNKSSNGIGTGTFIANISGLLPSTTYYVRAYAINSFGTVYSSNEVSFTTNAEVTVADIDGNIYHTITIGTQVWMVENLKTTKFNDGTSIPLVPGGTAWSILKTPGYCFYNNDAANKNIYGALYNWYTVKTDKLAPTGWHVPTDAEWTTLTTYLTNNGYGGSDNKIAKSMASKSGWISSSTVGTVGNDQASNNSSGFAGLPGGECAVASVLNVNGLFQGIEYYSYWWSSSYGGTIMDTGGVMAYHRNLRFNNSNVGEVLDDGQCGFSVRCLKDK